MEGSVFVDGIESDVDDTQVEETQGEETQTQNTEQTEQQTEGESEQLNNQGEPESSEAKPQLTEKGTKLDPNPQSAAYQLLANERRAREQAENILRNPDLLKQYIEQSGILKQPEAEEPAFNAENIKTADDVINALNTMRSEFSQREQAYENTIRELKQELTGLSTERSYERIAKTIESDIVRVREAYPELNPKSPQYNKEIEKAITNLYHRADYDPQTKRFMGKVTLAEIADTYMQGISVAKQQGSREAQTRVIDKSKGKVVTSSKATAVEEKESTDPGANIAREISKLFG
jgi:hypothetical protein